MMEYSRMIYQLTPFLGMHGSVYCKPSNKDLEKQKTDTVTGVCSLTQAASFCFEPQTCIY